MTRWIESILRIPLLNPALHGLEFIRWKGVNAEIVWNFRHCFFMNNFILPDSKIQIIFNQIIVSYPGVVTTRSRTKVGHTRWMNNGRYIKRITYYQSTCVRVKWFGFIFQARLKNKGWEYNNRKQPFHKLYNVKRGTNVCSSFWSI